MPLVLTTTAGLVIWLVLWSIGQKAIDAFLITMLLIVVAATAKMVAPFLPGNRRA